MNTRFTHAIVFGVIASMASVGLALVLYLITGPMSGWNYLSYLIALVIFGLGAKKWAGQNGGYISYGQGYVHMLIQALTYTLIIGIWTYIFFVYIAPDALNDLLLRAQVEWEARGLSQDQIDTASKMFTPKFITIMAFVMNSVVFAVTNLIVAAIVKNDAPPMFANGDQGNSSQNFPPQS